MKAPQWWAGWTYVFWYAGALWIGSSGIDNLFDHAWLKATVYIVSAVGGFMAAADAKRSYNKRKQQEQFKTVWNNFWNKK